MAMLYIVSVLLFHSAVSKVSQETCSQEESGNRQNSPALLQVASSAIRKHGALQHDSASLATAELILGSQFAAEGTFGKKVTLNKVEGDSIILGADVGQTDALHTPVLWYKTVKEASELSDDDELSICITVNVTALTVEFDLSIAIQDGSEWVGIFHMEDKDSDKYKFNWYSGDWDPNIAEGTSDYTALGDAHVFEPFENQVIKLEITYPAGDADGRSTVTINKQSYTHQGLKRLSFSKGIGVSLGSHICVDGCYLADWPNRPTNTNPATETNDGMERFKIHSVSIEPHCKQQADYENVVAKCCTFDMMEFVRQEIEKQGLFVCSEGSLAGMAVWHDCADDKSSYTQLLEAIEKGQEEPCKWIGTVSDCPKPPAECGGFTGTLAPCKS